jgi:hypothetical protein
MLQRDLLDIINEGQAWAFVGAGASMEAGVPGWNKLLEDVVEELAPDVREMVLEDGRFRKHRDSNDLPKAFSRIAHFAGRDALEEIVRSRTGEVRTPGRVQREIADWPFRGYLTTNYDGLIEAALRRVGQTGWTPVGNANSELLKVSGDPTHVVWHVHGALALTPDRAHLVITEDDYEDIYAEDGALLRQIRGLLTNRRLVMIGFGLSDPHVMELLRRIGRFASPVRPIYAFAAIEDADDRAELLDRHNIDVIPYRVAGGSHTQLSELLKTYGGMILRRSLRFGKPARPVPSHDPETTGLLLYNEFLLRHHPDPGPAVIDTLLRAWLLSLLSHASECQSQLQEITQDLAARAALLRYEAGGRDESAARVLEIVRTLAREGTASFDEPSGTVALTEEGRNLVSAQAATAERLKDQFATALRDRAASGFSDETSANRVGEAAQAFMAECIRRRALGVAMAAWTPKAEHRSYQLVALLQDLPTFMEQLADASEAIALTRVVQDIFAACPELLLGSVLAECQVDRRSMPGLVFVAAAWTSDAHAPGRRGHAIASTATPACLGPAGCFATGDGCVAPRVCCLVPGGGCLGTGGWPLVALGGCLVPGGGCLATVAWSSVALGGCLVPGGGCLAIAGSGLAAAGAFLVPTWTRRRFAWSRPPGRVTPGEPACLAEAGRPESLDRPPQNPMT